LFKLSLCLKYIYFAFEVHLKQTKRNGDIERFSCFGLQHFFAGLSLLVCFPGPGCVIVSLSLCHTIKHFIINLLFVFKREHVLTYSKFILFFILLQILNELPNDGIYLGTTRYVLMNEMRLQQVDIGFRKCSLFCVSHDMTA